MLFGPWCVYAASVVLDRDCGGACRLLGLWGWGVRAGLYLKGEEGPAERR
jgi:hypothetical protein